MSELVADVTRQDLAVLRQGERNGQRAVTGEDADFDRAPCANQLDQQSQKLSLLRRNLHLSMRMVERGCPQIGQHRVLAQRSVEHVVIQPVVQVEGAP